MSLETVLKIGNALRKGEDSLKYFKYVSNCPKDKEGNYPLCISIPVLEDYSFDWNAIKKMPENKKNKLYYLRFKTSDSDGLMKYIFGDIYYSKTATIKKDGTIETAENGGYRLPDSNHSNAAYRPSSFKRGTKDFEDIIKGNENADSVLLKFRNSLSNDLSILEKLLENVSAVEYFLNNPAEINFLTLIQNRQFLKAYSAKQLIAKTSKATLKKLGIKVEKKDITEDIQEKLQPYKNGEIFIHFQFPNNKSWYDFKEDFNLINQKMLFDFVEKTPNGLVLKKTLYKTLCSGDKKNDSQFPNFNKESKYKSKVFSTESIQDLFYAIDYSKKGAIIPGTDIKIIILPCGEHLNASDYENFQNKGDEEQINQANLNDKHKQNDNLFSIFEEIKNDNITSFDVIFSKKGSTNAPDVDLIEISGLKKSSIRITTQRIADISHFVYQKRNKYLHNTNKQFSAFSISSSFRNILGNPEYDQKTKNISFKADSKYQSHILKILPLIYTNNYYSDDILLYSFIRNTEYSIRAGNSRFNFLKFDLEFIMSIQNNEKNTFMTTINSESYQIGNLLGGLAKNFAGENSPIKSFEKNYVGNLTRRISSIEDFIKLKNDIEQKLIMHDKTNFTFRISYELAQKIKEFKGIYDKEECAFGFFESYFKPIPKKETSEISN